MASSVGPFKITKREVAGVEMLTIKTIRDLEYYLQQLMADYYLGPAMTGKEPPGRWSGESAESISRSAQSTCRIPARLPETPRAFRTPTF